MSFGRIPTDDDGPDGTGRYGGAEAPPRGKTRLADPQRGKAGMTIRVPVPSSAWPIEAESYHQFIGELCENIPEEWDDDVAAEAIILRYVRHLESLVPPEQRLPVPGH